MRTTFYQFLNAKFYGLIMIFCLIPLFVRADVLWNEDNNIYSQKKIFQKGDTLKIIFNEKSIIDYNINFSQDSVNKANTQPTIGTSIDFLPTLGGGDNFTASQKSSTKNKANLNASITIQIQDILPDGNLRIAGTHTITVNNAVENIQITGLVNPKDVKNKKFVYSNDIINPTIIYNSQILKPDIINNKDYIQTFSTNISTVSGKTQKIISSQYKISDKKSQELIIKQLNKILNILFK